MALQHSIYIVCFKKDDIKQHQYIFTTSGKTVIKVSNEQQNSTRTPYYDSQ